MTSRYLLRESHQGRVVPRPDLGLHPSRQASRRGHGAAGQPDHHRSQKEIRVTDTQAAMFMLLFPIAAFALVAVIADRRAKK